MRDRGRGRQAQRASVVEEGARGAHGRSEAGTDAQVTASGLGSDVLGRGGRRSLEGDDGLAAAGLRLASTSNYRRSTSSQERRVAGAHMNSVTYASTCCGSRTVRESSPTTNYTSSRRRRGPRTGSTRLARHRGRGLRQQALCGQRVHVVSLFSNLLSFCNNGFERLDFERDLVSVLPGSRDVTALALKRGGGRNDIDREASESERGKEVLGERRRKGDKWGSRVSRWRGPPRPALRGGQGWPQVPPPASTSKGGSHNSQLAGSRLSSESLTLVSGSTSRGTPSVSRAETSGT